MKYGIAHVEDLADAETIIDVRSPAEYAEDHVPGAVNCPVLDNDERWNCPRCRGPQKAERTVALWKLPQVLVSLKMIAKSR